jgi:hypothetical protein
MALALCSVGDVASAWGPVGHRAVGAVADELLTPATQFAIAQLLADDRDRDGRPSGRRNLADVADWADEIRGEPGDHPRWHFDNQPMCQRDRPAGSWCAQGECASAQISAQLAILTDRQRSARERNEALKWIVHLAGDLHQPLHATDFAEGGNLIHLAAPGRPQRGRGNRRGESLHAFWDTRLVTLALHPSRGSIPARSLQRLLQQAKGVEPALLAKAPQAWAAESNELARDYALKIDGIGCNLEQSRQFPVVTLPSDYVADAKKIVEQRLALAGARLAFVLNRALGEG